MEILTIDQIKAQYPDEWVLVGNPELDASKLHVLSGMPMLHSKDKKEVCYMGREQVKQLKSYMIIFTGTIPKNRKFWLKNKLKNAFREMRQIQKGIKQGTTLNDFLDEL